MEPISVSANTPSPMAAEMLTQPVLATPGCEDSYSGSSLTSPSSVSSSTSIDKTDNHDLSVFGSDAPDMQQEEERLKSFDKWPLSFLSPELLAKNGFYYLGREDEVRCAFCKVEIMKWVEGDDPAKDHQRWEPQCPFLRRQSDSSNIPHGSQTTL